MTEVILGIDPGLSGAIAFLGPDGTVEVIDMPTLALRRGGKAKRELDLIALARMFDERVSTIRHAFVEQVGAMPGQGIASMFAFGKAYGALLGVLSANFIPMTTVSPVVWKKALAVPAGKDAARARASQLLPRSAYLWPLTKHDGRAEAALIALYGERTIRLPEEEVA